MKPAPLADRLVATEEAMNPTPLHNVLPPTFSPAPAFKSKSAPKSKQAPPPILWTAFWREFCLEDQPHERCHIPPDGRAVVDHHWIYFAEDLPLGARVIDLGCGAGTVGRTLLTHRKDLRVTGVDFADVPALTVPNLAVRPGIDMEALPFGDASFDAAVSLFGIEYSNIARTASELARVLRPGAAFSFLVHHHGSETVHEGSARRGALQDLLSARVKTPFLAGSIPGLDQQIARLNDRFPGDPSIALVTRYLRHHITGTGAHRQAIWQDMLDNLGPEIALLTHLQGSAKSPAELCNWLAALLPLMQSVSVSVLRRKAGQPIAWQVDGRR
jgi:SAM-dependent methyltransferase